ncbi:MAG: glycoside hydrolase family 2, partial [Tannerella sp.]|nr:glycoside hydrolase family 2 [Tannerella sp.]
VTVEKPDPFVMVNRYIRDNRSEFFFFVNAHLHREHHTRITFPKAVTSGKYPWVWDMTDGSRYRVDLDRNGTFSLYLGPAESRLIVFDYEQNGTRWNPLPLCGKNSRTLEGWDAELYHSCENVTERTHFFVLEDLKQTKYINFTGTVIYTKTFHAEGTQDTVLNLGKVWGVAEVRLNGEDCGVTWFGNRLYDLSGKLKAGENRLEIRVITTMGNYVQTLTDNEISRKWTNRPGRAPQPKQSMGLGGPVTLYEKA